MTNSMTGYARIERETDFGPIQLELRSVNHRYLEPNIRAPEELRPFETAIRETLSEHLSRGKVDCNIRFHSKPGNGAAIEVDEKQLTAVSKALQQVQSIASSVTQPTALELLRWPGVVKESKLDVSPLAAELQEMLVGAIKELKHTRQQEGERLAVMLQERLDGIEKIVAQLRGGRDQSLDALRTKLKGRIEDLGAKPDTDRIEQEIVIAAQKLDVDEELDRLGSHITAAREAIENDAPKGRRLDFLMQEFNREANTLGSKSASQETTEAAVNLKVLIEQMREQVQNIE